MPGKYDITNSLMFRGSRENRKDVVSYAFYFLRLGISADADSCFSLGDFGFIQIARTDRR